MRALLSLLVLLLVTMCSFAAGSPNSDGYYPSGEYYYWPTSKADGTTKWDAYSRRQEYTYGYNSYGYRYPVSYKWVYYQAYDAPPYPIQAEIPLASDPQWIDKMTDIVGKQMVKQAEIRKQQLNYAAWEQGIKLIGAEGVLRNSYFTNPITTPDGPPSPYGSPYGNFLLGAHGGMGNTLYAMRESDTKIFGSSDLVNLNVGLQQASQHVRNAQTLAGQGQTDFVDLLKQFSVVQAGENERIAKLAQLKVAMEALKPDTKTFVQSREFSLKQEAPTLPQAQYQMPQFGGVARLSNADFMVMARQDCGACHSGPKAASGFDIESYPTLSMEAKSEIWNKRLLTTDPKMLMPRDRNNVGHRLPDERLRQYLLH